MLGIYLQSSVLISTFFSIFISILWWYSESILIWLHQEPQVARMAALYLRYLIPGLFAYGSLQCMLRFLQTQTVVIPLVVCSVVPLVVHVALTYVTVHVIGLGFKGTALSGSISLWISFVMLALYVRYSDKFRYTWEGFSAEAFHQVLPCMKLAVPSAVMVWSVFGDLLAHRLVQIPPDIVFMFLVMISVISASSTGRLRFWFCSPASCRTRN